MRLESRSDPPYWPEANQTSILRLGLKRLNGSQWMHVDGDLPQFHRHKLSLYRARPGKVSLELPGSKPAQAELSGRLLAHLLRHHGGGYQLSDGSLCHRSSGLRWPGDTRDLWHCSLWVPEDFCLLQESASGEMVLTAASVCSPSNWELEDKIGKSVDVIHGPVPAYQLKLSARVNRLLRRMKPGQLLMRYNWSVQPDNELFWREDRDSKAGNKGAKQPQGQYWRIERQTFSRLPKTGAIVFGIRIYLHSIASLSRKSRPDREFHPTLQSLIDRLPADQRAYKGLE